jgi:Nuclear condensing complex subunits, C-term domain
MLLSCTVCRNEQTKLAAINCIIAGWTRKMHLDPLELLQKLDPLQFEDDCAAVMNILLSEAERDSTNSPFSMDELNSLNRGIKNAVLVVTTEEESIDPYRIFFTRLYCEHMIKSSTAEYERERLMSQMIPDIPMLCDIIDMQTDRLNAAIMNCDDDATDREIFVSLQLIRLAALTEFEEGAIRHFNTNLKRLVSTITTPEDLVEECLKMLHKMSDNEDVFFQIMREVVCELIRLSDLPGETELELNYMIRILLVIGVSLELCTSGFLEYTLIDEWESYIIPCLSSSNSLVREAAIPCLGKLGLLVGAENVEEHYKPLIFPLVSAENEETSIRGQSLLTLSDWTMLQQMITTQLASQGDTEAISDIVETLMDAPSPTLVPLAAEVATKLLYNGIVQDANWLARLLVLFFDQRLTQEAELEGIPVTDIGSPVRLQQHLSLFFPAYCSKSEAERQVMLDSITALLDMTFIKSNQKKRPGKRVTASLKPVEYVISMVELGRQQVGNKTDTTNSDDNTSSTDNVVTAEGTESATLPDATLNATCQVSFFLLREEDNLNITQQRALSKFIGGYSVRSNLADCNLQRQLRWNIEELTMAISDQACLKSLETVLSDLEELRTRAAQDTKEIESPLRSLTIGDENTENTPCAPPKSTAKSKAKSETKERAKAKSETKDKAKAKAKTKATPTSTRVLRSRS